MGEKYKVGKRGIIKIVFGKYIDPCLYGSRLEKSLVCYRERLR
jgi:hypothetical protein